MDTGTSDLDGKEKIEAIHSRIDSNMIPKLDLEFETENEAYNFYNTYALKVGFSVRISKGKADYNGRMISRVFCCSCEGYRKNDKRDPNVRCPRSETRFGCLAKMKVNSRVTGKYRVVEFIPEHSHATTSPSKSHLHRSHRKLTLPHIAEIDNSDRSGVRPKTGMELLAGRVGGHENVGITLDDYKNYLRTKRTVQMEYGEASAILKYLQNMQSTDPNFMYSLKVDDDGMISNIFWADGKMRADYYYFGDVVSFDTTYKKNKDARPFAMFIGVNHHKQSIIFGAALLYDETAESFEWLFDAFYATMCEKKPITILTDQDAAMAKALSSKWPETYHRLCIWHIYQNAAKHLSAVFGKCKEFASIFRSCIYDFEEEDEFFEAWNKMLVDYDLLDNDWLKRLFDLKE